tara:strand:- start:2549 stop:3196 length:648 start_codon:yes stop_codon:yes gene_type:complete
MKPVETTKIGGMRRKIKRVKPIKKIDNSKEFKIHEKKCIKLNELIKNISINEYTKFKLYLDTEMEDIAYSMDKYDLLKSSKINFKEFKENRFELMYNYYCCSLDRPLEFKIDSYTFFKNNFEQESLLILLKFIDEIIIGIEKKTYLENNKDNYTSDDVNYAFDLLKLDKSEIPSKEQIKNAYDNLLENTNNEEIKLNLNKSLDLLLNRYYKNNCS